jgi:NADH-quinone oxidoreductase subunit H
MTFAMFFLAEYAHIILMGAMTTLLFLGGWLPPFGFLSFIPGFFWFSLKTAIVVFWFVWVRASFPRMRYDQLMALLW